MIHIEVAYVGMHGQVFLRQLCVPSGCTIFQAIELSEIFLHLDKELSDFKAWFYGTLPDTPPNHKAWFVGIFSQKYPLNHPLTQGDRVEIYRPLTLDPMNNRKHKVNHAKKAAARLRSQPQNKTPHTGEVLSQITT